MNSDGAISFRKTTMLKMINQLIDTMEILFNEKRIEHANGNCGRDGHVLQQTPRSLTVAKTSRSS